MSGVAIVVFSDLVDSTALLAQLGDDRMEAVRRAHVGDVRDLVEEAGGRVVKTLGDGVMASFDSALGALSAAAGIQAAVERLDAAHERIGIAARVGVAAGEPIADGGDLHGMTVVIASRLSSAAATGEVLVQDLVQSLVASRAGVRLGDAREYELKGVPLPVRAAALRWRELAATESARAEKRAEPAPAPEQLRLPPVLAAFAAEPLIGRKREIEALREATARGSGRRAVLLLGEPGIGKTRHAAAAAAAAHSEGTIVVLARCPPEAAIPFEPWVRAIGELALGGGEAWRQRLATAAGPELAALVPELSEHAPRRVVAAADGMVAAEGARYRLLRGIDAALACGAGEAPLQVVLDDAHWCDPASAQALGHLLEGQSGGRLSLVVTARDRELGRGHPVSRALADLRRTDDLSELHLTGLDAAGLAALVGTRTGRAITPQLAERLRARTAGNPFFVAELTRDLEGQGALRDGDALEAAPVPDAVAGLVEERLARLDPDTERLLAAVATIGPAAPVDLAARAAGLDPEQTERAVGEALSERLVDDVVASRPTLSFPHALVREALIAGTGDAALTRLHLAVARALEEEPHPEPADLARHYGLAVELAGPEPAVAAYQAAALAAAEGHDHEQAAAHLRRLLPLLPDDDPAARAAALLELGEQDLLSGDLVRARRAFGEAIELARASGDADTLARAALGFAGGDIGFGWELGTDDPVTEAQLREGLELLGDENPRLALRMIFRLSYLAAVGEFNQERLAALARRAAELGDLLGDAEAQILARFSILTTRFMHYPDPARVYELFEESLEVLELAEECEREDLVYRVVQWSGAVYYTLARIPECEAALARAGEIAERLGSPRFTWEVDLNRGWRLFDLGRREEGEAQIRRAGAVIRRLRPDLHLGIELAALMNAIWIFGGDVTRCRVAFEAIESMSSLTFPKAAVAHHAGIDGDLEVAHERLWELIGEDLEPARHPDGHFPPALCVLSNLAATIGDRAAGERLRPLLEPLRGYLVTPAPAFGFGLLPEAAIGRLELLAGRPAEAVAELRSATARADSLGIAWQSAWVRVDLALALNRLGSAEEAAATLTEAESWAQRYGVGWALKIAARARAEIAGEAPPEPGRAVKRARPLRGLAARGGRRALAAMVGDLDDIETERRFAEPRRQRALMRAMARGFQPGQANGFSGTIAYELEPYAIERPADAPWRWAIEVDSKAERARLVEPAPLDAAVTIYIGLADWARVTAGLQNSLEALVAGRCRVEGDVVVAVQMEAMFGGR